MKIIKILIGISLIFLIIGVAYAANNNEIFTGPGGLHPIAKNDFVDEKGHNLQILDYTDALYDTWFKNDTENGYLVQPYENNNSFYIYADDENDCGVLEIVEKDNNKYIINSWTPNGSIDAKLIVENLFEFNDLNKLTPLPIEG